MVTKTNIKCKMLPFSEKLEIIKKVDTSPNMTCTKGCETTQHTGVLTNSICENKKNTFQHRMLGTEKLKTSKHKKTESVLLSGQGIPIHGSMLTQKTEERALKLNAEFTPMTGWIDVLTDSGNMHGLGTEPLSKEFKA
jgi:hypothetical protein